MRVSMSHISPRLYRSEVALGLQIWVNLTGVLSLCPPLRRSSSTWFAYSLPPSLPLSPLSRNSLSLLSLFERQARGSATA
jgi:hypothetical protein